MDIDVVALFPDAVRAFCEVGVLGRAQERGIVRLRYWDVRAFADDARQTVDDRPYGGGPGMVLMAEPLARALTAAKEGRGAVRTIYLSPSGRRLDEAGVRELMGAGSLVLVAGRYEGIDERVLEAGDEEWSIGDYVLSGGEVAAGVVIDALVRQLPGALGHEDSAREDSFAHGLLDHPHYTRPEEWRGREVPPVLLSGDHGRIRRWRLKAALGRTWLRRPDLLAGRSLTSEEQGLLEEFQQEYRGQGHE